MSTTTTSIKIDTKVKAEALEVVKSAGLTLSAVINNYLRLISATRRIEIYAPEPMTPKLEKLIGSIERDINNGELSKEYSDVEEFLSDLKA